MWQLINDFLFNKEVTAGATAVIAVVGSFMVAAFTAFIGRNKFQSEKLWDARQIACNTIVSQLKAGSSFAVRIEDGFTEDYHRYYESDNLTKANSKYWEFINVADDAFNSNYLLLPPAFRRRYEWMLAGRAEADFETGPDGYLTPIYAHRLGANDLLDIAVVELRIGSWPVRQVIRFRPFFRRLPNMWQRQKRSIKRRWNKLRGKKTDIWDM